WFFDPIDGTRAFVRGVPLYGVMIAMVEAGEPVLGVVHLPALEETVYAARGEGCRWNGAPARVSGVADLGDALVLTTGDASTTGGDRQAAGWDRLRGRGAMCRTWGDCYGYVLVATGRAEAMIDPVLNTWDAAALFPIIEEAGGVVTDLAGLRRFDGGHLVATNRALGNEIRTILQEAR
ncbi:MAG: inositol monophosphatase family protein, partial [Gemmatimonadota bacterium]